jgi:hypothetical protein
VHFDDYRVIAGYKWIGDVLHQAKAPIHVGKKCRAFRDLTPHYRDACVFEKRIARGAFDEMLEYYASLLRALIAEHLRRPGEPFIELARSISAKTF